MSVRIRPMIRVDLQLASVVDGIPAEDDFRAWVQAAVRRPAGEVLIRIVDRLEGERLNERYRHRPGPTNVLSFPFTAPPGVPTESLGDIVICAPLVVEEARVQGKEQRLHWAHLTIHGALHLQGYDHQTDEDALLMEAEEVAILAGLGLPNPYAEVQSG